MASCARRDIYDPTVVGVYHINTRTSRRSFLLGEDYVDGRNYDHRRGIFRDRLIVLTSIFAIDVGAYNILDNHYHLVVRNRPDLANEWSEREVVTRWLQLSSKSLVLSKLPKEAKILKILKNPKLVARYRRRLSNISWFMGMLNESIARAANKEDRCVGSFWDDRFHCVRLETEESILSCLIYVDLNQIRALMVDRPEYQLFSSIFDRIQDRMGIRPATGSQELPHSGWLAPLCIDGDGYDGFAAGRRASNKGFSFISLDKYLELADWSGRQFREGKRGAIPSHLDPILKRLKLVPEDFLKLVNSYGAKLQRFLDGAKRLKELSLAAKAAKEAK